MTKQTALTHFLSICLILISVLVASGDILFVSDRDWNSEIYIMDEAGNNPRNLINGPKADSSPSWSPDKQQSSLPEVHALKMEFWIKKL